MVTVESTMCRAAGVIILEHPFIYLFNEHHWQKKHCLTLDEGLKEIWKLNDIEVKLASS